MVLYISISNNELCGNGHLLVHPPVLLIGWWSGHIPLSLSYEWGFTEQIFQPADILSYD